MLAAVRCNLLLKGEYILRSIIPDSICKEALQDTHTCAHPVYLFLCAGDEFFFFECILFEWFAVIFIIILFPGFSQI